MRLIRNLAGGAFGVTLAVLVPFWVVQGTRPAGHAALWILYGVLATTGLIWLVSSLLVHQSEDAPKPPTAAAHARDVGPGAIGGSVIQDSNVSVTYNAVQEAKPPDPDPREFIPEDVTPDYLVGLFEQHTTVQAGKLLEPYIGRWMRVERARVNDVEAIGSGLDADLIVSFSNPVFPTRICVFKSDWKERLEGLRKGTYITVVGRLHQVSSGSVALQDCELEALP